MFEAAPIPVTILTGFLGSGKTTLLNRLLQESGKKRFAVIENEFGEIGIDQELVGNSQGNLFEMNNGCLCCTVKTDLIRLLEELWERRAEFDYVLIESTGLADPGAVIQTFVYDRQISQRYRLDGIIAVADALHLPIQLKNAIEASQQLRYADVILLNKIDLVEASAREELEKLVRFRNLHARLYPTTFAQLPTENLLDIEMFNLDNIIASDPSFLDVSYPFEWLQLYQLHQKVYQLQFENTHRRAMQMLILYVGDGSEAAVATTIEGARAIFRQGLMQLDLAHQTDLSPLLMYNIPAQLLNVEATIRLPEAGPYLFFLQEHPHYFALWNEEICQKPLLTRTFSQGHAHADIQSVVLTLEGVLHGPQVDDWLQHLLHDQGDDIYRMKGILSVSHTDQKIIVQSVHRQLNSRYGADWGKQARQNILVFIGRHLDKSKLESGLRACVAQAPNSGLQIRQGQGS